MHELVHMHAHANTHTHTHTHTMIIMWGDGMVNYGLTFCNIYVYEVVTFYTLNLHMLYVNNIKAGKEKFEMQIFLTKEWPDQNGHSKVYTTKIITF